ncbi:MAG: hypothetical protein IJC48_08725 [Clostridia bacterium]|nr:hypothetical protein [Clostridia bacterium]
MKCLSRWISLALAVFMIFGACTAYAQENHYMLISDPYFSDGQNVYDLSGLTISLSHKKDPSISQWILAAVTSSAQSTITAESDGKTMYISADGFESVYTAEVSEIIGMLDGQKIVQALLDHVIGIGPTESVLGARNVRDIIGLIYGTLTQDLNTLNEASTATIDTFNYEDIVVYEKPVDYTGEQVDKTIKMLIEKIEALLDSTIVDEQYEYEPGGLLKEYQRLVEPMKLSVKGSVYYGQDVVFIDCMISEDGTEVFPIYAEITNTSSPVIYVNVPFTDESGNEHLLYATVEADVDGYREYMEAGILTNEIPSFMILYTNQDDDANNTSRREFYTSAQINQEMYEFNLVYASDRSSYRDIWVNTYFNGVQAAVEYSGVIEDVEGEESEYGKITLATNLGLTGNVSVMLGVVEDDVISAFEMEENINIVSLIGEDGKVTDLIKGDIERFFGHIKEHLSYAIPGFGSMIALLYPEGNAEG